MKLISSASYHALHTSGFIKLPSEWTLYDYSHYFESRPGFHSDLNEQLEREITSLPESRRYVSLLIDEMKIKDLVYNKYSCHIVGFMSLGEINDLLSDIEWKCVGSSNHPPIAKNMF